MDSDPAPNCFAQMEQDLQAALENETRSQLENDAKIRAINQRVSYDEFRELVRAAHLKPANISSAASSRNQRGRIWNNIALSRKSHEPDNIDLAQARGATPNQYSFNQFPSGSAQFLNNWQTADNLSRLSILYKLGPTGLSNIFTVDMPTALLGEIFEALLSFKPTCDVVTVVRLLEALTQIKRFSLVVHFLNSAERAVCQQLIHKLVTSLVGREQDLAELGITEWSIHELGKKFLVKN